MAEDKKYDFLDLGKQFQEMMEKNVSAWMDSYVSSESYASGMGWHLNNYLNLIENWKKNLSQNYNTFDFVTKEDVTRLAGQLVNLENKIDDIQTILETLQDQMSREQIDNSKDDNSKEQNSKTKGRRA